MPQTMLIQHGWVPAHSSRDVMRYLGSQYPGRWIGWNETVVRPHPISLLPTSTCGAICRASVRPTMWLGRQYARSLMSFRGPGILGATKLSYALTVMVDHLNIFCKALVTVQMPYSSQPMNSFPQLRYLSSFLSLCFLLPHLAKDAVWTMYLYDTLLARV
jgi:hypothetical protein